MGCWKMGKETGKENGGPPFAEVKRNGRVQLSAPTAPCMRHLQELRRPLSCGFHGWQWCRHAWQDCFLRAEERWCWRRQEKVSVSFNKHPQEARLLRRHAGNLANQATRSTV